MKRQRCKACRKNIYPSIDAVGKAALSTSLAFGKPTRFYRCPRNPRVFHITTKVSYG